LINWDSKMHVTEANVRRPGISDEFVARHDVRHVGRDEAETLLGFQPSCGGLWIAYPNILTAGQMQVNGRDFGRLRLDTPSGGAKYLSPKNSGAHVYVSQGVPFNSELVIVEGEFKAMALCEAGIRAVGIGGINSAMKDDAMIPDLAKIVAKWPPACVLFLGDNDTCLNFAFAHEAHKLSKALPPGVELRLPRIPINSPKGIDDVADALGGGFPDFWTRIKASAIKVGPELPVAALAIKLVTPELPAIAELESREPQIQKLVDLASHLDPLNLRSLAQLVKETLGVPITAFRESAKRAAEQRKKKAAEEARERNSKEKEDVAQIINDPRPKIEVPGSRGRLASEFAVEIAPILAKNNFFSKDRIIVCPDQGNSALGTLSGRAFRTKIEKHIIPFRVVKSRSGEVCDLSQTISKEDAETLLESDQLIDPLPAIRAVNNVRLPVMRSGHIELLPEGYDAESTIFTNPGGPEVEDVSVEKSVAFLRGLFSEFCFREKDEERALSVAISAMLTLFVFNIIPKGSLRPGFLYTANAEGSGKTLMAKLAMIPRMGFAPAGSLPEKDEEIEKRVFSAVVAGLPAFFMDNGKRHVSSGALESALTATHIEGRILGQSKMRQVENMMTVFLTGNGATISPDLRRRVLHVDLFMREAKAEYRNIEHPIDDVAIIGLRSAILSALWSVTQAWDKAGRPAPKLRMNGYESWSDVVCGILEYAGFASPCSPAPSSISGDRDTRDMETLVEKMPRKKDLRFPEIVDLCREYSLFDRLVGESDEDFDKGKKNILGRIFTKFDGRIFASQSTFHVQRPSKNVTIYYVKGQSGHSGHCSSRL
jgi:hypothetical protein